VPEFGGFITNYNSAYYSSEKNKFYPPSKTVAFNSQLKINDGLLANKISVSENINYNDALKRINDFVNKILIELNSGRTVNFENIGCFKITNKNLVFTPYEKTNWLKNAYGLPPINMPVNIARKPIIVFSEKITNKSKLLQKAAVAIPFVLLLTLLPFKNNKINLNPLSSTAFYTNQNKLNIFNNPDSMEQTIDKYTSIEYALYYKEPENTNIKANITEKVNKTDSISTVNIKPIETIKNTTPVKANEISEPLSSKKYFIIAGSFVEMSRVEVFCNELKTKNFNPELVKRDGKLRISVASFEDKDLANKEILEFRTKHPEYPVWLLSI